MVIPKGYSKVVGRKKADNTMPKSKWAKRQTRIYTNTYLYKTLQTTKDLATHTPLKTGVNICAPKG